MTWKRFPASTWGLEAMPVDSASVIDIVRGNTDHLMRQSPASCGMFWINGPPSTTSNAFDDASTMWRSPRVFLRSGLDRQIRALKVRIMAYMDAGTGTLRFCISRFWHVVAATPAQGDQAVESTAGEVVSTSATAPTEVTLRILPLVAATQLSGYGTFNDNRTRVLYRTAYLSIQAKAAATRTITVQSFNIEEEDPP